MKPRLDLLSQDNPLSILHVSYSTQYYAVLSVRARCCTLSRPRQRCLRFGRVPPDDPDQRLLRMPRHGLDRLKRVLYVADRREEVRHIQLREEQSHLKQLQVCQYVPIDLEIQG